MTYTTGLHLLVVIEASLYPIRVSDYRRSWTRDSVVSSGFSPLDWQLTLGHRHLALPLYTFHICIHTPTLYTHFIPIFMLHITHIPPPYTCPISVHIFHLYTYIPLCTQLHLCTHASPLYTHSTSVYTLYLRTHASSLYACSISVQTTISVNMLHLCTYTPSLCTRCICVHAASLCTHSISVHTLHLCAHAASLYTCSIFVHMLHLCTYALYLFFCVQFPLHISTHNDWRAFILNASFYLHHLLRDSLSNTVPFWAKTST